MNMDSPAHDDRPRRNGYGFTCSPSASPAYILLAALVITTMADTILLGFSIDPVDIPLAAAALLLMIMVALTARTQGASRLATVLEVAALTCAATISVACMSVVLATTRVGYYDQLLDRADHLIFPWLSWNAMFEFVRVRPRIVSAMCAVYQSILWQPFFLVTALAASGRETACWAFVRSWCIALVACLVIFPLVPAAGEYVYRGLTNADIPALSVKTAWRQYIMIESIRSGLRSLTPSSMSGLISFPSFHAASAVVLAAGFRRIRCLARPFAALNIAMVATAPLVGAHYFVDIAAGLALGAVSVHAARRDDRVASLERLSPRAAKALDSAFQATAT